MTDGRLDAGLVADRRAQALVEFRRDAEWRREHGVALGRPRGILTEEAAAERRELAREESAAASQTAVVVPAAVPAAPVDAEAAWRTARLAVVAALVLALLLVWLRQRRAGARG